MGCFKFMSYVNHIHTLRGVSLSRAWSHIIVESFVFVSFNFFFNVRHRALTCFVWFFFAGFVSHVMFILRTWIGSTTWCKWISAIAARTRTNGHMISHRTIGVNSTLSDTWIDAITILTAQMARTFDMIKTFTSNTTSEWILFGYFYCSKLLKLFRLTKRPKKRYIHPDSQPGKNKLVFQHPYSLRWYRMDLDSMLGLLFVVKRIFKT